MNPTVDELRAKINPATAKYFDVPAGEPEADCSGCDADGIYWIVTAKGAKMLVDVNVPGGIDRSNHPDESVGRGVAHFATCPRSKTFKRPKR